MVSTPTAAVKKEDELIDHLILLLALWALMGVIFLAFNDGLFFEWLGVGSNKPTIAHVSHVNQDVRRRVAEDFIWAPTLAKEKIHNNDSIFTGDDSTADIVFKDKSRIAVGPNSLVTIRVDAKGKPVIAVTQGVVLVKAPRGKKVQVLVNNELREIPGTGEIVTIMATPPPAQKKNLAAVAEAPPPAIAHEPARYLALATPSSMPEVITKIEEPPTPSVKRHPFELSVGASYLFAGGKPFILGEGACRVWASEISSSREPGFIERIGISAKHSGATSVIETNRTNADLRFKIQRGLWNHERVFGLMVGYQRMSYLGYTSNQVGAGLFWGQPLGGRFLSSYSKWIEAEFQYFPYSPGMLLGPTFNISTTGKLFVSNQFYLYTQIGYTQNDYTDSSQNTHVQTSAGYGMGGAGVNF